MKPLHICYVSQEYPPETGWGGIGTYTWEMANGLAHEGHRVTVIARAVKSETVSRQGMIEVHRIQPSPALEKRRVLWRAGQYWPGFAWAAMKTFRQVHADKPIDLVETAEARADGLFIAMLRRRPAFVARLHTAWAFVDRLGGIVPDRSKRAVYQFEKQVIRRADAVSAPSQAVVDLTATWTRIPRPAPTVIPNPMDVKVFRVNGRPSNKEVLYVGRLEARKGMDTLEATIPLVMRRSHYSKWRLIGASAVDTNGKLYQDRIREAAGAENVSRICFENLTREQIAPRLQRAAVSVFPSVWENFPYTILEAMACGSAIVASRTGGIQEMIEDGVSGLLVPPNCPTSLADAICKVLEDKSLADRLARNGRKRVEELYNRDQIVARMTDFYRSVADSRRALN
jgi:glycosyltransferase involved in cell wall biosynthesis